MFSKLKMMGDVSSANQNACSGQHDILPFKLSFLTKKVSEMKDEFHSRRKQLNLNRRASDNEYEELREEWAEAEMEERELSEQKDNLDRELAFVADECFWRQIHRKHIMEDLTDLKKRQRLCLADCMGVLTAQDESPSTVGKSTPAFFQNVKTWFRKLFNGAVVHTQETRNGGAVSSKSEFNSTTSSSKNYLAQSAVYKRMTKRQKRRNNVLNELVLDLEEAHDKIDELVIRQYATYIKEINPAHPIPE